MSLFRLCYGVNPQGNLRIVGIHYDFGPWNTCHDYEVTR